MSDIILKIISSTREFLPPQQLIDRSVILLKQAFPDADEIYFSVNDDIQFVDAGANWGKIICPNCGKEIDGGWWREAMAKAYESRFSNLDVVLPSCGTKSSLAFLKYEWPVGFARFVLNVRNPKNEMDEQTKKSLESILGTSILLIWALY
jgi:hypothetical protein